MGGFRMGSRTEDVTCGLGTPHTSSHILRLTFYVCRYEVRARACSR